MANRKSVEDYEKILKTREVRRKEQFLFYLVDSEGLWKATPAGEQLLGVWPGISSIFDEKKANHIVIKIEVNLNIYVILVVCCIQEEEARSDRRIKLRLIPERWEEGKKHFYDKYGPVKTHILMTQLDSITNIPTNFSLWRGSIFRYGQEEQIGPPRPTPPIPPIGPPPRPKIEKEKDPASKMRITAAEFLEKKKTTSLPKEQKLSQPFRVAVYNYKGGVGKTTTTIELSSMLAHLGWSVLMVDGDPQYNLTYGLLARRDEFESEEEESPPSTIVTPPPSLQLPFIELPNCYQSFHLPRGNIGDRRPLPGLEPNLFTLLRKGRGIPEACATVCEEINHNTVLCEIEKNNLLLLPGSSRMFEFDVTWGSFIFNNYVQCQV